jgi:hypothetical protein
MANVRLKFKPNTGDDIALEGRIFDAAGAPVSGVIRLRPDQGADVTLRTGGYGYQFDVVKGEGRFTLRAVRPSDDEPTSPDGDFDTDEDGVQALNYPFEAP